MYGEWKVGNDLRRNFLTGREYSLTNDILPVLFSERVDYNKLDLYKGRIPTVDDLVNFIISYEDFKSKPYELNDQLLIGHGLSDVELINKYKDVGIPEDVSRSEVVKRVNSILASHEQRLPGFKDLPQNVKLAIADIVYNGKGDNELLSLDPKSPNLKAAIASGDLFKIISEMNHSQTADGWLGVRSAARRAMALGGYD
jgi:GH24 family phage-related lysozyme (muramidase)